MSISASVDPAAVALDVQLEFTTPAETVSTSNVVYESPYPNGYTTFSAVPGIVSK